MKTHRFSPSHATENINLLYDPCVPFALTHPSSKNHKDCLSRTKFPWLSEKSFFLGTPKEISRTSQSHLLCERVRSSGISAPTYCSCPTGQLVHAAAPIFFALLSPKTVDFLQRKTNFAVKTLLARHKFVCVVCVLVLKMVPRYMSLFITSWVTLRAHKGKNYILIIYIITCSICYALVWYTKWVIDLHVYL